MGAAFDSIQTHEHKMQLIFISGAIINKYTWDIDVSTHRSTLLRECISIGSAL